MLHKHYSEEHLAEVMEQMERVRERQLEQSGLSCMAWLAEGPCHRIRAAVELGEEVEIVDVSGEESIEIQEDGEMVTRRVEELLEELNRQCTIYCNY